MPGKLKESLINKKLPYKGGSGRGGRKVDVGKWLCRWLVCVCVCVSVWVIIRLDDSIDVYGWLVGKTECVGVCLAVW